MTSPVIPEEDAAERGGFDAERFFTLASQVGHTRALGLEYEASGNGWMQLAIDWRDELVGVPEAGIVASGAIVSLIDTASGGAIWSRLGRFRPMVTLNLRLDYLRPARKGERVHARCECTKITRQIAFVRGVAHVGDPDDPIAHSAATFMFLD
jgi:uncharacterized protein (TIGR00369 family)